MVDLVVNSNILFDKFVLVGYFMGFWVGVVIVVLYLERIIKLVLMDGWVRNNVVKVEEMEVIFKVLEVG